MEQIFIRKRDSKRVSDNVQQINFPKCDICHEELRNSATFYQSGFNERVICELCYRKFSENDIGLMINLFNAYGGYFGKYKKFKPSVYKRLKELTENDIKRELSADKNGLNLQLLHAALLFGFTPKEYFQGFEKIN